VIAARTLFKGLRSHWLVRNTSWIILGQGANFLLQVGYFTLLARLLGVKEYGLFAGAFALVNIIAPYSALGANMLYMRYVSASRESANVYWGNALLTTAGMSALIAAGIWFLGPLITRIHDELLFLSLVVSNCLLLQITSLAGVVFITLEKMRLTAISGFITNLARFLMLLVLLLLYHHATAAQWSLGAMLASAFAAVFVLFVVRAEIGKPKYDHRLIFKRVPEGIGFSFAGTTQTVYNDVDKTMLSHFGLNRENGFYSLAYKIIDFATTPIVSIGAVVLPKTFGMSVHDMRGVMRLTVKSAWVCVLIGAVMGACTLLVAPFLPLIVGKDFSGVLAALRWLCWIPMLRAIHQTTGGALTGTGNQSIRTIAQTAVAIANFALNLWWIPAFGWVGAAWSSVVSDGLLAVLNTLTLYIIWRKIRRKQDAQSMVRVGE